MVLLLISSINHFASTECNVSCCMVTCFHNPAKARGCWCKQSQTISAVQTALKACYHFSHDVKEVHFVLFGSDTYNIWISEAEKHFKTAQDESSQNGMQPCFPKFWSSIVSEHNMTTSTPDCRIRGRHWRRAVARSYAVCRCCCLSRSRHRHPDRS